MVDPPVPPRLFAILAREAPVGVIFRRGPSRWSHVVRWDTATDRFEPGQWRQIKVDPRCSDVSADGTRLIYHGINYASAPPLWTAVSRVPGFTAVTFIGCVDAWHPGGGRFTDGYEFEEGGNFEKRLKRDGWTSVGSGDWEKIDPLTSVKVREKKDRSGRWCLTMRAFASVSESHQGRGVHYEEYEATRLNDGAKYDLTDAEWADWDHRGRLAFTRGGKLFAAVMRRDEIMTRELYDANPMSPPITA